MDRIRDFMNRSPWLGWVFAAVMLGVSVLLYMRMSGSGDTYSPERMTEDVTIRFSDTGDEITMPRGRFEKELRMRGGAIDPSKGIINPKTNEPTGFLFNKAEWDETVARLNTERESVVGSKPSSSNPKKTAEDAELAKKAAASGKK